MYNILDKVYYIKYALHMFTTSDIKVLIQKGEKLAIAIENYPSRGQTAVQELYQTAQGKLFLKRVSERNHEECQINVKSGTLAEREFWAFKLANTMGLFVPPLWLMDEFTTVQIWLDYPDGKTFKKSTGKMDLIAKNVFECAVFDWVTGQIDRHDANYLFDYTKKRIIPVDSAHGFLKYEGALPDYLHLFEVGKTGALNARIKSNVKKKLDDISNGEFKTIVPLREEDEFKELLNRKNMLSRVNNITDLLDLYRSKK